MRKLNFKDCFKLAGIISKANVRQEISELLAEARQETAQKAITTGNSPEAENSPEKDPGKEQLKEKLGIKLVMLLVERSPQVETEIYDLLAGICGKTSEEIAALEITEIVGIVRKIAEENDLSAFFTSALS